MSTTFNTNNDFVLLQQHYLLPQPFPSISNLPEYCPILIKEGDAINAAIVVDGDWSDLFDCILGNHMVEKLYIFCTSKIDVGPFPIAEYEIYGLSVLFKNYSSQGMNLSVPRFNLVLIWKFKDYSVIIIRYNDSWVPESWIVIDCFDPHTNTLVN